MNCVIFDMIHCSVYPIIVGFAVCRYYENTDIPRHLKALRGVHQALLQYVSYWLPEAIQEKFRHFKVFILNLVNMQLCPLFEYCLLFD